MSDANKGPTVGESMVCWSAFNNNNNNKPIIVVIIVVVVIIISMQVRHLLFWVHPITVRSVTGVPEVQCPVSKPSVLQISYCFFKRKGH